MYESLVKVGGIRYSPLETHLNFKLQVQFQVVFTMELREKIHDANGPRAWRLEHLS